MIIQTKISVSSDLWDIWLNFDVIVVKVYLLNYAVSECRPLSGCIQGEHVDMVTNGARQASARR